MADLHKNITLEKHSNREESPTCLELGPCISVSNFSQLLVISDFIIFKEQTVPQCSEFIFFCDRIAKSPEIAILCSLVSKG